MFAIETFALEKWYRAGFWRRSLRCALRPLTLTVEEGEIFGYLGPNGAGKTTTLKLLMGLVFPSGGSARIFGRSLDDPVTKSQIGFLPEQPYFYDYLTAIELLNYYAQLSAVPARERSRRVQAVLARVGLAKVGNLQLRKFSKGMLQRVGIAQAIVHEPKAVFLDEPMSGLDPIGRREVRDLIQSLKDQGKTIFFSTHILSDAEALCDRVAVLHEGELRGVGVVAELAARMSGKVELLWEGSAAVPALRALGAEIHATGETVRAILPEPSLNAALETLRRAAARLISVTPVRITLEDYFVERLGKQPSANLSAKSGLDCDLAPPPPAARR
jgi:ABC-2 type transport system ATP-binding protein